MTERVVLAHSGGLDTPVAIGRIAEETGAEVVAVAGDVGQGGQDTEAICPRVIVEHPVAAAKDHGASLVAHGCTGKGSDQVRSEVGIGAPAPDLQVLAPVRLGGASA